MTASTLDALAAADVVTQLVLLAALVARLTVLVVVDKVGAPVRNALGRLGPWGQYLAGCPWCVGLELAIACTAVWILWPTVVLAAGAAAAGGLVAGYIGAWLKESLPPPAE